MYAQANSGDQSNATYFVVLLGFLIISLPALFYAIVRLLIKPRTLAISLLVILSTSSHGFLAFKMGFFEKLIQSTKQKVDQQKRPAITQLRRAFSLQGSEAEKSIKEGLQAGADPDTSISDGVTMPILTVASSRADLTLMKLLLDSGANPNQKANVEYQKIAEPTPLDVVLWAEVSDQQARDGAQMLIESGAVIHSSSVLLGACQRGDYPYFTELSRLGAKEKSNKLGDGCLHLAIKNQHTEFVRQYLLDMETEELRSNALAKPNDLGQYPLDIAANTKNAPILRLLISHNAPSNLAQTEAKIQRLLTN